MINYTLKQLYSFEAVIRLGGFTSASKELHITTTSSIYAGAAITR